MADEKKMNVKPQDAKTQEIKKPDEKKPSAFSGVDALFNEAAPKTDTAVKAPMEKTGDELALVPTQALHGFPDHPYTVNPNDDDMAELVDSIQREGLLERIVVQRRKEGGFEILSGHRRARACEILGISEVPVIIKNGLSKDQAILLMVDANLKRKNILPMDEAKALRMQLDAMDRMGQRPSHGKVKRTDETLAEKIGKNRMYVQRKVKLLDLTPNLQEAINDKTLAETPAFEIAFLPAEVQELVLDWMQYEDRAPTVAQAIAVRQHQQELAKISKGKDDGKLLTEEQVERIMDGEKLKEIFPPPPEPAKDKQEEKEQAGAAEPQPPADVAKEETSVTTPVDTGTVAVPTGLSNTQTVPSAPVDSNAIPFQAAASPESSGTVIPPPTIPVQAAAPAQPTTQTAQTPTADAQKNYIRTEYMAELRKENVILPKTQVKDFIKGCSTNSEYVAALVAALEKGREQTQEKVQKTKAVEIKPALEKPTQAAQDSKPLFPPVASGASVPPVSKTGATVKLGETAKTSEETKTSDTPKPPITQPTGAAPAPKPVEVASAAKANMPISTATPAPKPTEQPKPSLTLPPKTDLTQQKSGIEGLDSYLRNKPRPGKDKPQQGKAPSKPR